MAAAFYISSMAPELIERHGIDYADVRPVVDAFGRGDVERALELATPEIGERLSIAGDPAEWIERQKTQAAILPQPAQMPSRRSRPSVTSSEA